MTKKVTFGLIVGNRGFFPDHLVSEGRSRIIKVLEKNNYSVITLSPEDTKYGSVETLEDAYKCGNLFFQNRDIIDGIIVTLPNFGDEKGIANSIKFSGLNVPILVHAFSDIENKMSLTDRRDSFCGKISACNNLLQYGYKYSLTENHTVDVDDPSFKEDIKWFSQVCKIVKGLKNARMGAIGARTGPFNTVRYSEKILEDFGISIEVIDLFEVIGMVEKLKDEEQNIASKLEKVTKYINTDGIPKDAIIKMAKFGYVIDRWIAENHLNATAIQCWTALETYFGIVPCTIMSMLSENLLPSACEVDIPGAISMYAMQLASDAPSAIVDWNNNYGNNSDKAVIFHCSNLPKSMMETFKMDYQGIISQTVGKENAYGSCVGRLSPGIFTFARMTTDDTQGIIKVFLGEGEITSDPLNTFGGYGVIKIPNLQNLLKFICINGFEHHVAINKSSVSRSLLEAFHNYFDWKVYFHK